MWYGMGYMYAQNECYGGEISKLYLVECCLYAITIINKHEDL